MRTEDHFDCIITGGGHAGLEAAWAAANVLGEARRAGCSVRVALVTLDPARIGVMSCNPAIGGLAKGQLVREVDALGGLMGLITDASGIQFRVLNETRGAAVRGPRAQCDKHAYARTAQALIASRSEIHIIAASVERICVSDGPQRRLTGLVVRMGSGQLRSLMCRSAVLTTGTFMRGLMHTGAARTEGGRHGEAAAVGISDDLRSLGFELGRLKTGTPPRLKRSTIDWDALRPQHGDERPVAFSELSGERLDAATAAAPSVARFPVLKQVDCRMTETCAESHALIMANLHRAPMYSGQIESAGPRYCPSIEDKVVRFAERTRHGVYLEPESLDDDWVYCNGISTSLPTDVQDALVRAMPGCERAEIYRYGYAVEYDMVRPHQIFATGETRLISGLFLAGQINGTSGYEEAAAQGVVAGLNAARCALDLPAVTLGRHEAYIGVMMDDLVTKTPVEPYRMFTSRAEHRLTLRADNAPDRLTPWAMQHAMLGTHPLADLRRELFERRRAQLADISAAIAETNVGPIPLAEFLRRQESTPADIVRLARRHDGTSLPNVDEAVLFTAHTDAYYFKYVQKSQAELRRMLELEGKTIPPWFDYESCAHLRTEARQALMKFRPVTMGQALRLEGLTPADIVLLGVLVRRGISQRAEHSART